MLTARTAQLVQLLANCLAAVTVTVSLASPFASFEPGSGQVAPRCSAGVHQIRRSSLQTPVGRWMDRCCDCQEAHQIWGMRRGHAIHLDSWRRSLPAQTRIWPESERSQIPEVVRPCSCLVVLGCQACSDAELRRRFPCAAHLWWQGRLDGHLGVVAAAWPHSWPQAPSYPSVER